MKRISLIMIMLMLMVSGMVACNKNPYIGEYKSKDDAILKLLNNNKCQIIDSSYKDSLYTMGKYSIDNNNIIIDFDKDNPNYFSVASIKGIVEGKRITLYKNNKENHKDNYIFEK